MRQSLRSSLVLGVAVGALAFPALAQDATPEDREQIVVTGTRVADRTALEAAAPVDVIAGDDLL